jgi:hypothetical protein
MVLGHIPISGLHRTWNGLQVRECTKIQSNEYPYAHRQIWKAHSLWQWPDDIGLVFVRFGLCSSTHRRLLQCVDFDSITPQMLGPVQRGIREADEAAKFGGFVA